MNKKIFALALFASLTFFVAAPIQTEAASVWSFCADTEAIEKDGLTTMTYQEYKNFDLIKGDLIVTEKDDMVDDYTVVWKSSNEDAVWINKRTGQARANKFNTFTNDSATVRISATITNTKTGKQIVRAFFVEVDNCAFTEDTDESIVTPTPDIVTPTVTPTPEPTAVPSLPDDGTSAYIGRTVKKITLGSTWKTDMTVLMDTIDFRFGDKVLTQSDILGIDDIDYTEVGTPTSKAYIRTITLKVYVASLNPNWGNPDHYLIEKVAINHYFDVVQ